MRTFLARRGRCEFTDGESDPVCKARATPGHSPRTCVSLLHNPHTTNKAPVQIKPIDRKSEIGTDARRSHRFSTFQICHDRSRSAAP
ncbi:hypothetical protein SAFG77S_11721 [Streptomyces afghaniensis]